MGQELAVRLLQNSLYRDLLFPVYLFSGQRGCGKTTLARIFATALNCRLLGEFRAAPRETIVPCGTCDSCEYMKMGIHPDFHEIDAASHPGVDHVRQLIETTALVPQVGTKRIYLIDEAHMLSKAACNALLKTLEEPVCSAVFLLATTEPHKILETVRSRCFMVSLYPLEMENMISVLERVCQQEQISYEREGLRDIIMHAEGSARDAITNLERVFIAYGSIESAGVRALLNVPPQETIHRLCDAIIARDHQLVIEQLGVVSRQYQWTVLVDRIIAYVRERLVRLVVQSEDDSVIRVRCVNILVLLCEHEPLLQKTAHGTTYLYGLLLRAAGIVDDIPVKGSSNGPAHKGTSHKPAPAAKESPVEVMPSVALVREEAQQPARGATPQDQFIEVLKQAGVTDALTLSILSQGKLVHSGVRMDITLPERLQLFKEHLDAELALIVRGVKHMNSEIEQVGFVFAGDGLVVRETPQRKSPMRSEGAIKKRKAGAVIPEHELDSATRAIVEIFPGTVTQGGNEL